MLFNGYRFFKVLGQPLSFTINGSSTNFINLAWHQPDLGGRAFPIQKYVVYEITTGNERNTTTNSIKFDQLNSNSAYMFTVAAEAINDRVGAQTEAMQGLTSM